ncbi:MAG TPA: sensor histidine kinase [Ruminiclostridium sp.]
MSKKWNISSSFYKSSNAIYRAFNNLSIMVKIFCGIIFILSIVIMIFSAVWYEYSKSVYENEAIDNAVTLVDNFNMNLEDNIDQVDRIINSFYRNKDTESLISKDTYSDIQDQYRFNNAMDEFFQQVMYLREDLASIFLYVSKDKNYSYFITGKNKLDYFPENEQWYKDTIKANGKTVISIPHQPYQLNSGEAVISYSRALQREGNTPAVVVADFSTKSFEKILEKTKLNKKAFIFFSRDDGRILYENKPLFEGDYLDIGIIKKFAGSSSGKEITTISKVKYLVTYNTSVVTGWKILLITPYSELVKDTRKLIMVCLLLSFISLVVTGFISYGFARMIYHPIKNLQTGMTEVKNGNFNFQLETDSYDELGQLVIGFNSMISTIRILIFEKYKEKIARKDAEYKYLQAQINPHFMYNTLQTIKGMAVVYKVPDISNVAKALAKMLRYSLDGNRKTVAIRNEVENMICFMEIQKKRFKDLVNYEIEIDEGVFSCSIIKLILQPIAENSITHGIEKKGSKGIIKVTGYFKGENICIEILDNGEGMTAEELELLLNNINSSDENEVDTSSNNNNIGLKNINQRLKLVYGQEYGLRIESIKGEWTSVKIEIPIDKIDEVQ